MFTICGTAKLLKRVKQPVGVPVEPDTQLGNWYATVLAWKPQAALFVNEQTLLPVLLPLAPAKSVAERFPTVLGEVLARLGVSAGFIETELQAMKSVSWSKTVDRSVNGSVTEFAFLAGRYRASSPTVTPADLVELSLRLSNTPCSPLYKTHISPNRAVAVLSQQRN